MPFVRTLLAYMSLTCMLKDAQPSYTPMSEKCDAIINPSALKLVKDWRSFRGMVNFLSQFLKGL